MLILYAHFSILVGNGNILMLKSFEMIIASSLAQNKYWIVS